MKIPLAILGVVSILMLRLVATISSILWSSAAPLWVDRIGWVLVHSTWQLAVIAICAAICDRGLRGRSANVRYLAKVVALFTMVAAPYLTWIAIGVPDQRAATNDAGSSAGQIAVREIPDNSGEMRRTDPYERASTLQHKIPGKFEAKNGQDGEITAVKSANGGLSREINNSQNEASQRPRSVSLLRALIAPRLTMIVAVWVMGVLLFMLRPIFGLWIQRRYRHIGLSSVSNEVQKMLDDLTARMRVSRVVRVAQSACAVVPMVVGYARPLILLPGSVLSGLTPDQLESLLAHELAHISRNDWLVNAIQVVIETFLFYHPAVWWLSNGIRRERELCCDDMALAVIGNRVTYGRMLLELEQLRHPKPSMLIGIQSSSVAATGGDLVQRIRRLMPGARQIERSETHWISGTILVVATILLFGMLGLEINSAQPLAAEPESDQSSNVSQAEKKDREPAERNADQTAKTARRRALAQLTPKLSVELVAVTTPEFVEDDEAAAKTGDAKRDRQWWRPDGTPLRKVPDAPTGKKVSLRTTSGGDQMREFLVRIHGLEHPYTIWSAMDAFSYQEKLEAKGTVLLRMTGRFRAHGRNANVTIGLAHDAWGPIQQIGIDAKPMNSVNVSDVYKAWYDEFRPLRVENAGQVTRFWHSMSPKVHNETMDFLVEAIDTAGKSHPSVNSGGSSTSRYAQFPIPLSRVAHIQYKFRPFRSVITFRNVSLEPGRITDVGLRIQTLAQGASVWKDAADSNPPTQEAMETEAKNSRICEELNGNTAVDFTDIPLRDGLIYLGELHRMEIAYDAPAVEALAVQSVSLKLNTETLSTGLAFLLHPFHLSYLVEDGKLIIATHDEVRRRSTDPPVDFAEILARLDEYPAIRWEAILRGQDNQADANTIATLQEALFNEDAIVQQQAAMALYWLAEFDKSSIPHLKRAANVNDWRVRRAAYFALAAIGRDDFSTLPFLVEAWPQDEVVRDAWFSLIQEYQESVYSELEKVFPKVVPNFRRDIVRSAFNRAVEAKDLILLGLSDDDAQVRKAGLDAVRLLLRSKDKVPDELVAALRPFLKANDSHDRSFVAIMLLPIQDQTEDCLQVLLQSIVDGDPYETRNALATFVMLPVHQSSETALRITRRLSELSTSEKGAKQLAAIEALAAVQAPTPRKSLDFSWGLPHEGLQSRLVAINADAIIGEPIEFQLQFRDVNKGELDFDRLPDLLKGTMRIVGPASKDLTEVEINFSNKSLPKKTDQYDILTFDGAIAAKQFLSAKPGRYWFQFCGKNLADSSVLMVDIAPTEKDEPKDDGGKK